MENHSLLSFHPHNCHFPHQPEPPSTHQHNVDEELEEGKEALIIKASIVRYLYHHNCLATTTTIKVVTIDDGH
jgi:hypothetical protein